MGGVALINTPPTQIDTPFHQMDFRLVRMESRLPDIAQTFMAKLC